MTTTYTCGLGGGGGIQNEGGPYLMVGNKETFRQELALQYSLQGHTLLDLSFSPLCLSTSKSAKLTFNKTSQDVSKFLQQK